jgi:predicted nucleotidyltransferase
MKPTQTPSTLTSHDTDASLRSVLSQFPTLMIAMVFGSVALGQARSDSDLDIAVAVGHP